eukprot:scaffold331492_cov49-Prasinocladus_malaysianus.AAC.2
MASATTSAASAAPKSARLLPRARARTSYGFGAPLPASQQCKLSRQRPSQPRRAGRYVIRAAASELSEAATVAAGTIAPAI